MRRYHCRNCNAPRGYPPLRNPDPDCGTGSGAAAGDTACPCPRPKRRRATGVRSSLPPANAKGTTDPADPDDAALDRWLTDGGRDVPDRDGREAARAAVLNTN